MVVSFAKAAAAAVLLSASVIRANDIPSCGPGNPCPASAPCCSPYGKCGVGAYCLGGCDPLFSHSLKSCVPAPACKSADYELNSLNDVSYIDQYLGDASKTNWVASGRPATYQDNSILLTMAPDTVGTLMASTHYVWYGKISATMTTSQGAGVVTAFIMMSDVKDEIDFEFVGVDLEHAQSNYYSQGVTNYANGENLTVSNTVQNVHTYTIDWKPDSITWSIDGKVLRTKNKADTWNATGNRFDFPQTPSRVMLSLWPAGLSTNSPGTVEWAGGLVDWSSPYMQNGYYYAMVNEVRVECYDPPAGANVQGQKSYVYTDAAGTNDTVRVTDDVTVLASFHATGEDPANDPNAAAESSAAAASRSAAASATRAAVSASSAATSSEPETVPGMSGAGSRGDSNSVVPAGSTGEATAAAPDATAGAGSSGNTGGGSTGFQQGDGGSAAGGSSGAGKVRERGVVGGSVFAVVVAVVGLMVL